MSVKTSATALVQFKPTTAGGYISVGKIRDIRLDIRRDPLETTGIGDADRTYRYGIRGTSGSGTLLYDPQDVSAVDMVSRILSDADNDISIFGPCGIVGMPAMVDRVTTLDYSVWETFVCVTRTNWFSSSYSSPRLQSLVRLPLPS